MIKAYFASDEEDYIFEELDLPTLPPAGWILEMPSGRFALVLGGYLRLDGRAFLSLDYLPEGASPARAARIAAPQPLERIRPLVELTTIHERRREEGEMALGRALRRHTPKKAEGGA